MDNTDLIMLAGLGVLAAGLALAIPAQPRAVWLPQLLGVVAAVLGALVALTVIVR